MSNRKRKEDRKENTVEPLAATTSAQQPVFQNMKIKLPSQITIFGTSRKRPPIISDRDPF